MQWKNILFCQITVQKKYNHFHCIGQSFPYLIVKYNLHPVSVSQGWWLCKVLCSETGLHQPSGAIWYEICMFSLCLGGLPPSTQASDYSPETCMLD